MPHESRPREHQFDQDLLLERGLAYCDVCQGGEGTLPTECPGVSMSQAEQDRVYAGILDYRHGRWHLLRSRESVIRLTNDRTPGIDGALRRWESTP